ncbi:hypothetical protein Cob_v000823 [Colletotrichum orbiculare MAFF 240422]|uniref:Peptidase A1 domain-containing protein n=1 Tax=Colletotrichum orbiculare (strain 104-T / ATCC 96160 / CBS 514.97 / LARS 414 / MAFF 240422) TaxID=1213857 RepID=A0A484GA51_COLOR|nr:hypothetical protein Cob_v000823 [Colletotrichum orbiculare MAFF 240422]
MLSIAIVATVLASIVCAQQPSAVALTPSTDWYGFDGNWSAVKFQIGSQQQSVSVLVSTSLSEFWAVGSGGCLAKEPLCSSARGNIFSVADSKSWDSLGAWQLGLDYLDYGGNGDYGLDTLSTTTLSGKSMTMKDIITASFNSTDYYLGYLGLGITKGSFGNEIAESPLTQAVKTYGWIPSYSYGYTAGAYYKGTSGTPCSVTLGGYDASRFVMHNQEFSLDPSDGLPHALVRGIEVTVGQDKALPGGWDNRTRILSNMSTSFSAMIDSSTPYLWLPDVICDQFAAAFNLTYNTTFDLYTLTDEQYTAFKAGASSYSFTFSLTSHDNNDDFGRPLQTPGVVNITVTAAAFAQALRYPFMDEAIKYGEPAVPYFPLRRGSNFTNTFIIGRSFLQEAYLITKYDTGVFSIHQAVFPEDSQTLNITEIKQPNNSPYPPPAAQVDGRGLTTAQMAGIVAGVVTACLILLIAWYCIRRRKRANAAARAIEEGKDTASTILPEAPRSPMARFFFKMMGKNKARRPSPHEIMGSTSQPVEVAADANNAVYELPAQIGPAELDGDDSKSIQEQADFATETSHTLSTPPENQLDLPPAEKSMPDVSPVATYRADDVELSASASSPSSPTSPISPIGCDSMPSNHGSLPSPMTSPQGDWTNRILRLEQLWTANAETRFHHQRRPPAESVKFFEYGIINPPTPGDHVSTGANLSEDAN